MLFGAAILRDAAVPVIGPRFARTRWRLLRMTVLYNFSDSNFKQPDMLPRSPRAQACRGSAKLRPSMERGHRECRVSDAPVVRAKNARGRRHRFTGCNRHSLRNGFTVSFALSLVTGLVCHHRPQEACFPRT
jgi:hypothetical protein